ncbi:hypothetical protein GUITHDRAFT_132749 [Guillardia theta CCMP2712]|uniref:Uncharacterized protein n=2 Tax=Guillardia theta TaxID=55529 RepID=L1JZC2_GUITC|nr:hypothetical protein GUITHDRAFT_132749 [Guillardia theta CCMP2712]EKX53659.1 hypothetical protein GUITHDRAFT_132749 [Guillardia theta CCMP2712]|eukprot:XP_005840639.1 hypothetical protein GUITHDRAFT_132749 [Guillardia theta CCMP2712]
MASDAATSYQDIQRKLDNMDTGDLAAEVLPVFFNCFMENKTCKAGDFNFDVKRVIVQNLDALKRARDGNGGWKLGTELSCSEILAGGSTQNGKTMVKAVVLWICNYFKVGSVVLSTTKRGTRSLFEKLHPPAEEEKDSSTERGTRHKLKMPVPPICLAGRRLDQETIKKNVMISATLFANDTAQKITKISELFESDDEIRKLPMILIVDEADSFYRRKNKTTQLEAAMDSFIAIVRPILRWNVSATLIPVVMHMKQDKKEIDCESIIYTELGSNYLGAESFVPPQRDGRDVFLNPKDKKDAEEAMDLVYKDAFQKRGSLTLVITNPKVHGPSGIFAQAEKVLRKFPHVAALIVSHEGITLKPPTKPMLATNAFTPMTDQKLLDLHRKFKGKTASYAIEQVDENFGIETPLVIFGYRLMIRGDSFVSKKRVPTHLICALGKQMSIEKVVQACGRATYQRSSSHYNFHEEKKVVVLTYPLDFDTTRAYPRFLAELHAKMKDRGLTLAKALSAREVYSYRANIQPKGQLRSIGQKLDELKLNVRFEDPPRGEEGRGAKWLRETMGEQEA